MYCFALNIADILPSRNQLVFIFRMKALLKGIRVIELAGLAPVPHCGLVLADAGAHVTVVERVSPFFMPAA